MLSVPSTCADPERFFRGGPTFLGHVLHHVTYSPVKLEVAMSNSLGEDALTSNDSRTHRQTEEGPTLVQK